MPIFALLSSSRFSSDPRRPLARVATLSASFALAFATFAASDARAADVAITPEARSHFTAGVNLLKDPDGPRYEEAYREFKVAYAASPSFKILGNLGLCAMKLERDQEAIDAYEKYLQEGKDQLDAATVQQVQTDLQTLKAGVVTVTVSTTPPGATIIDSRLPVRGEKITNTYGPVSQSTKLGIHAGTHQMTAKLSGYPDVVWEFDTAGAREVPEHTFEFKAAPVAAVTPAPAESTSRPPVVTQERPVPTGVWVGVAATGALAIGTAVTGVLALSKHSDFTSANNGQDPANAQSIKDSGKTLNIVSDVFLAGTVVAAGVTAALYFGRPTVETEARPASASAKREPRTIPLRIVPAVGTSGGGIAISGGLPWM